MASILLGPLCWLESIEDGGKEKGLVLKPKAWLSVTIFPKKSGIIPTLLCQLINNPDPMAYSLEKPGDGVPYANQDGGETFVVAFPFPLKNQEGNTRAYSHYLGFKTQAGQVCRVGSFIVEGGGEIVDFQGTFLPLRMNVEGKSGMKRMAPCSLHVENPPSKRLRTGLAQDLSGFVPIVEYWISRDEKRFEEIEGLSASSPQQMGLKLLEISAQFEENWNLLNSQLECAGEDLPKNSRKETLFGLLSAYLKTQDRLLKVLKNAQEQINSKCNAHATHAHLCQTMRDYVQSEKTTLNKMDGLKRQEGKKGEEKRGGGDGKRDGDGKGEKGRDGKGCGEGKGEGGGEQRIKDETEGEDNPFYKFEVCPRTGEGILTIF